MYPPTFLTQNSGSLTQSATEMPLYSNILSVIHYRINQKNTEFVQFGEKSGMDIGGKSQ